MKIAVLEWGWPVNGNFQVDKDFARLEQLRRIPNEGSNTESLTGGTQIGGRVNPVAWDTVSSSDLSEVIREVVEKNGLRSGSDVGYVNLLNNKKRSRVDSVANKIQDWARAKGYDAVVWNDLPQSVDGYDRFSQPEFRAKVISDSKQDMAIILRENAVKDVKSMPAKARFKLAREASEMSVPSREFTALRVNDVAAEVLRRTAKELVGYMSYDTGHNNYEATLKKKADCVGAARYLLNQASDYCLPRDYIEMMPSRMLQDRRVTQVTRNENNCQAGDVLFFRGKRRGPGMKPSHVVLALGNNEFFHCTNYSYRIVGARIESLETLEERYYHVPIV